MSWGCPICGSILEDDDEMRPVISDEVYRMLEDIGESMERRAADSE